MAVRLIDKREDRIVLAKDLRDGQIGVIIAWLDNFHIGKIIQAYRNNLVVIGQPEGQGWSCKSQISDKCLVRLLEDGDTIEVFDNLK